ncbi:hypothetical protein AGR56_14535 [Clostridium sp. DMHC 10]|uniref:nucleoside-triphosphatase n=1 Tax=Clostridium sp. DMHC 10 TaxID=747377 RepID=UPI00069DE367|nr:nucleoside-triphosphatase [Clostridium sp. DMHC 10]KOF57561.1 hypothetical protein AGR56_14535 [Clostridium sp. DMHC 10]
MINIITGSVNSGKSTKLVNIYKNLGKGDGFFNKKIYNENFYIGQKIVRLSSGESVIWSLKGKLPNCWQEEYSYETYSFSRAALKFAEQIINSLLASEEPIFIDGIGPLELQNKGFHKLFQRCLTLNKELYVVIRKSCVKMIICKYNIKDYKII